MAKVFMSVLGTSEYVPAKYEMKGKISPPTPFVQEAYLHLTKDMWGKNDRIIIFLTPEARKKNWESGFFNEGYQGLYERLKKLNLPAEISAIDFKNGSTEEEIMENFLTIVKNLKEDDEVVFDITHSFRSLPMLTLVALIYAGTLKNIKTTGIYYGAFEVLGYPKYVKENIPVEKRIAPIFDLTPYAHLIEWTFAVDEFLKYGMVERLHELIKDKVNPILKETKGKDQKARAVRDLAQTLKNLVMNIYTCRCTKIEEIRLEKIFSNLSEGDFMPPFVPLAQKVRDKIQPFASEDPWQKGLAAVEWCIEHNLIQQGYTILEEAAISEVGRIMGIENISEDKDERGFVSSLLSVTAQKKPPEKWSGILSERKEEAKRWQKIGGDAFSELAKEFNNLANIRNDINHCGCREEPINPNELKKKLSQLYKNIKERMENFREHLSNENE